MPLVFAVHTSSERYTGGHPEPAAAGEGSAFSRISAALALAVLLTASLAFPASARAQEPRQFKTPTPLPADSTLIVGFLAKYQETADKRQPDTAMATRLRALNLPGVFVETAGESRYGDVFKLILATTGRDAKGRCEPAGCRDVRIILYGYLRGAEEMAKVERRLGSLGVPVALVVGLTNIGACEGTIPANVARAANICLDLRWVDHGRKQVRAEDPAKTQILANLRTSSDGRWLDISKAAQPDAKEWPRDPYLEFDPIAWNHAEDFILDELHRAGIPGAPASPH